MINRRKIQALSKHGKYLRSAGHKLSILWSGKYGPSSSSTGTCSCGRWEVILSSHVDVRREFRSHIADLILSQHAKALGYRDSYELIRKATETELQVIALKFKIK